MVNIQALVVGGYRFQRGDGAARASIALSGIPADSAGTLACPHLVAEVGINLVDLPLAE